MKAQFYRRHGRPDELFILPEPPKFIRSDNGPEFIFQKVRDWIAAVGSKTAYIQTGSPLSRCKQCMPGSAWENGYSDRFNARFRDEMFNSEIFYTLKEVKIVIEEWRKHYNSVRPHGALG